MSPAMAVHLIACEQKSVPHVSLQGFHAVRYVTEKSSCDRREEIPLGVPTVICVGNGFVSHGQQFGHISSSGADVSYWVHDTTYY
jgi:hypothetical protein